MCTDTCRQNIKYTKLSKIKMVFILDVGPALDPFVPVLFVVKTVLFIELLYFR